MSDPGGFKGIVKDAKTVLQTELKGQAHGLINKLVAPQEMARQFIHVRDFYNFIRASSANVPAPFFYFSPNFYTYENAINLQTRVFSNITRKRAGEEPEITPSEDFFKDSLAEFARFRYCIQAISFPELGLQAYSEGTSGGSLGNMDISNIYGGHSIIRNSYVNALQHTLSMNVLNTQHPVVENFLYPWLIAAVRTEITNRPIPRVNMAVKFWSPDRITRNMEGVKPDFIYYVTGLYPIKIDTWNPKQMSGADADLQRKVTFAFNDFIILNSYADAVKYNLVEFFLGNYVDNAIEKGKAWLNRKTDEWIDKLFNKKKKKKKNKKSDLDNKAGGGCPNCAPRDQLTANDIANGNYPSPIDDDNNEILTPDETPEDNGNDNGGGGGSSSPTSKTSSSSTSITPANASNYTPTTTNGNKKTSTTSRSSLTSTAPIGTTMRVIPISTEKFKVEDDLVPEVEEEDIDADAFEMDITKTESVEKTNLSLDDSINIYDVSNVDNLGEILESEDEAEKALNSSVRRPSTVSSPTSSNTGINRSTLTPSTTVKTPNTVTSVNRSTLTPSTTITSPSTVSRSLLSTPNAVKTVKTVSRPLSSSNVEPSTYVNRAVLSSPTTRDTSISDLESSTLRSSNSYRQLLNEDEVEKRETEQPKSAKTSSLTLGESIDRVNIKNSDDAFSEIIMTDEKAAAEEKATIRPSSTKTAPSTTSINRSLLIEPDTTKTQPSVSTNKQDLYDVSGKIVTQKESGKGYISLSKGEILTSSEPEQYSIDTERRKALLSKNQLEAADIVAPEPYSIDIENAHKAMSKVELEALKASAEQMYSGRKEQTLEDAIAASRSVSDDDDAILDPVDELNSAMRKTSESERARKIPSTTPQLDPKEMTKTSNRSSVINRDMLNEYVNPTQRTEKTHISKEELQRQFESINAPKGTTVVKEQLESPLSIQRVEKMHISKEELQRQFESVTSNSANKETVPLSETLNALTDRTKSVTSVTNGAVINPVETSAPVIERTPQNESKNISESIAIKSFRSLTSDSSIFAATEKTPNSSHDYNTLMTLLTNGEVMNSEKYSVIKEYSDTTKTNTKDVIEEYANNVEATSKKIAETLSQQKVIELVNDNKAQTVEIENNRIKPTTDEEELEKQKQKVINDLIENGTAQTAEIENNRIKPNEHLEEEATKQNNIKAAVEETAVRSMKIARKPQASTPQPSPIKKLSEDDINGLF